MQTVATTGTRRPTFASRIAVTVETSRNVVSFPSTDGGKDRIPSARKSTRQVTRMRRSRKIVRTRSQIGIRTDVGVAGSAKTTKDETRNSLSAIGSSHAPSGDPIENRRARYPSTMSVTAAARKITSDAHARPSRIAITRNGRAASRANVRKFGSVQGRSSTGLPSGGRRHARVARFEPDVHGLALRDDELLDRHLGHRARDGFAGRADRVRDLALGRPHDDGPAASGLPPARLGELAEVAGEAGLHVERGEPFDRRVRAPQPRRERPEEAPREDEIRLQEVEEDGAREDRELGLLLGDHAGGPRGVVEERHLAEVVAFAEGIQDDLAAVGGDDRDGDPALDDHVERVARLALLDDRLAAPVRPERGGLREGDTVFRRDPLEEGDLGEELRDVHRDPPGRAIRRVASIAATASRPLTCRDPSGSMPHSARDAAHGSSAPASAASLLR